jgi:hypothetical protein
MLVESRRKLVEKREALGVLFAVGRISAVVGSITRKVGTIPGRVESIAPFAGRIPAPSAASSQLKSPLPGQTGERAVSSSFIMLFQ